MQNNEQSTPRVGFDVGTPARHPLRRVFGRPGYRATYWVAKYLGRHCQFVYMNEYPKSGGTWFSSMLASSLGIPYPIRYFLPLSFKCVLHNHWDYRPFMSPAVCLYRDGRDVMVSLYFHRMRAIEVARRTGGYSRFIKLYDRLFGKGYDPKDARSHMAKFIREEIRNPVAGSGGFWSDHMDKWLSAKEAGRKVVLVSYESLLTDCQAALSRVLQELTGEDANAEDIAAAINRFSFKRMSGGRKQGEEDGKSHMRKGVAGDWVNHFTREAAEIFDAKAGSMLKRLGYAEGTGWWSVLDKRGASDEVKVS